MKILTATEMQAVDRWTAEEFGVSLDKLMEAAGEAVAQFCLRQYPVAMRVVVLCGKGNNGGDGFVAARVLAQAGRLVRVVLLGRMDEVKGEAAAALKRLREEFSSVEVDEVGDEAGLTACASAVGEAELLLDALVGTGFKPPLRGLAVLLREMVEKLETPVVAVDLPSGWDANSMEQTAEGSFRADAVVTFTAPKIAHVFGHLTRSEKNGGTFGPVVVAGIGSPGDGVVSASGLTWAGASKALAERPRDVTSNKGKFGHVLVVGEVTGRQGRRRWRRWRVCGLGPDW
ncbi:NAD(P)H-hydrate epimerase [Tunturiibacter gelidiferens]|uniref:NAD(P)H-hydrate epimerase n=1 Tax=Tunturiibacter gelidiferens TaxID=3069689 RepID=UPI003D9ACFEE